MNLTRLKMLEQFVHDEPDDPFNLYALAIEYQAFDKAKATPLFDKLLTEHPDYIPTYYQAGNLFWENGEEEKALSVLRLGVSKAKAARDRKAAGELQSLIDAFE